jgi:PAS domain S-box-containing protein
MLKSKPPGDAHAVRESSSDSALGEWSRRVSAARERLTLHPAAGDASPLRHMSDTLKHELSVAFEELQVAEEELNVQTEELATSRELLDAERERYRSLFETAPIVYLVTDPNGIIRDANRAASGFLGVAAEILPGKPLSVFLDPAQRRAFRDRLSRFAGEDLGAPLHLRLRPRDGRKRHVSATVGAVRGGGVLTELRWLLVDETTRRRRERRAKSRADELRALVEQATAELTRAMEFQMELAHAADTARERAERLSREKSELIALVSHELRTPLAAIGGYAELLALGVRGPLNDAQRTDALRIQAAQSHIIRLVDDLVGYAKLEAGRLRFDIGDVIVRDAIEALIAFVRPQASSKSITVTIADVAGDPVVRADEERLRQIVLNLLANAIKFTPAGGHVAIEWRVIEPDVEIIIRDSGVGIPAEKLEMVFEPFVQLEAVREVHERGWGLGLAISRDMARAMGGSLTAASVPGKGAAFTLRLPQSTRIASTDDRA